jgi:hypothetical protein
MAGEKLEVQIIFEGDQADMIRALAESYNVTPNEISKRLVTTGAKTVLGELEFKIRMRNKK